MGVSLTLLHMRWCDSVTASYHHIKHHIFLHKLFIVMCSVWQNIWWLRFFKVVTLLNSGHASRSTCLNLSSTSYRPWVCVLQMCDWFVTTGTQIDGQTGTRPPARSEGERAGRMWLIMATWLLTVSFRRAFKPKQNTTVNSDKVKEYPAP